MNDSQPRELVGLSEAARFLNLREDYVKRLADSGRLPCTRWRNPSTGNNHRVFRVSDLVDRRQARISSLREQLAKAEGGAL